MSISFKDRILEDEDGYLVNYADWSEDLAKHLAESEKIELEQNHWDVVRLLRQFYETNGLAPMLKILFNLIANEKGISKKEASLLVYQLFPNGPSKQAFKVAGLPRPKSCV